MCNICILSVRRCFRMQEVVMFTWVLLIREFQSISQIENFTTLNGKNRRLLLSLPVVCSILLCCFTIRQLYRILCRQSLEKIDYLGKELIFLLKPDAVPVSSQVQIQIILYFMFVLLQICFLILNLCHVSCTNSLNLQYNAGDDVSQNFPPWEADANDLSPTSQRHVR